MKIITLRRLTLEHFKGFGAQTIHFDRAGASIFGDNASGKTTIYDAYLWLLTGKDSLGRADFEIKPLDSSGQVIDHAAHSAVEALLDVDGDIITLRREYYERWTKRRGNPDAVFDGHSTDFYIDEIPKTKRDYEDAVAAIIPLDTLRLLSDLTAFPAMKWQERRKIIFELAGVESDQTLMARHDKYAPLLAELGKGDLDELRAKLKAKRKKISGRINDLPVMIRENRKTEEALGDVPFDRLRAALRDLEEDEHALTAEIARDDSAVSAGVQVAMKETRLEMDRLELENREYRRSQETDNSARPALVREIHALESALERATRDYKLASSCYGDARKAADGHALTASGYREEWSKLNATAWSGAGACPTCGQPLPTRKQEEARLAWEKEKEEKLSRIRALGQSCVDNQKNAEAAAAQYQVNMVELESEIARIKDELAAARAKLEAIKTPAVTDIPDYSDRKNALSGVLRELEQQLAEAQTNAKARTDELRRKRQSVREEMEGIRSQLAKENTLITIHSRIAELESERTALAAELAEIDRITDLADDFIRFKSEYTTKAVNDLFRITQFRLYSEQVNGETPPACGILHEGVPYDSGLNSGARINVGLDIVNTLAKHYGYRVPVFIDNAESVTSLLPIDAQIIRLVVSEEDKKVRISV